MTPLNEVCTDDAGCAILRLPELIMMARPNDTNTGGGVFGGWIMSQVDIAGSITAIREVKNRVVTVSVDSFEFHKPVFVGDVVSFYGAVERVGNTSVTIRVEAYVERLLEDSDDILVTEATLVYVSIDKEGRPQPIVASS